MPFKYACELEDVPERTAYEWFEKGERGEKPYVAFTAAVTRARAKAVKDLTERALAGGSGSSNALWVLERRYRADYGPVQKLELTGQDGGPVKVDAELRAAEGVRRNAEASAKIHDALAAAVGER